MKSARAIVFCLLLGGCATAQSSVTQPPPITCTKGNDCDAKWSRAVSWIATHSAYKVQTQTDSLIQTMGPIDEDPKPAYTVTKAAQSGGSYAISLTGGCGNIFGCVPTIDEARASFGAFVAGP